MAKIEIEKKTTTIDQATGTHEVAVEGKLKDFAQGFRDYVMKGPKAVQADITVNTGQYPEGHAKAGKWAIQIMIEPFDTEDEAVTVADRITPKLKPLMQVTSLPFPAKVQ